MANEPASRSQFRTLSGIPNVCASTFLIVLAVIGLSWAGDVPSYTGMTLYIEQYLATFLGLALAATFLLAPAREKDRAGVPWYDAIAAIAAIACTGYVAIFYPEMASSLSSTAPDRLIVGALGLFLILECTRRLFGWVLVILAVVICLYAAVAHIFPGVLYSRSASAERIITYSFLDTNGVFGIALKITGTVVIAFIFFGVCLMFVGGEEFFTQFAMATMGRFRGGTAKVSIVSSLLFGTVSGSAIANVVVSGSVTIPMMKRSGYPPHVAGAIEAVASTAGQITPPVMGITAFLIAENLEMSYGAVALAALLPALLYYMSLFIQTDLEAAKRKLVGLSAKDLPRARDAFRKGWVFLLPIGVLIYMLIIAGFPASVSGIVAALVTLVGSLTFGTKHLRPRGLLKLMHRTGAGMLGIAVVCALAGIVMGGLNLSGILFKMTLILSSLSLGHPIVLLAIVAAICIVLGMGLPSIVIYVLLSVLIAPALVSFDILPISAHLFIYYFGMLSMITPPICLATFAAMSLSQSKLWPTGFAGIRLGIVAYIVPFVFVFHPELVMHGWWLDILIAAATAALGVVVLSVGCVGYLFRPISWPSRLAFVVAGVVLMPAPTTLPHLAANLLGAVCAVSLFLALRLRHRQYEVAKMQSG